MFLWVVLFVHLFPELFSIWDLCSLSSSDLWLSELWLVCIMSSLSTLSIFSSKLLCTPRPPTHSIIKCKICKVGVNRVKYRRVWLTPVCCLHVVQYEPLSAWVRVSVLCMALESSLVVVHCDCFTLYDKQRPNQYSCPGLSIQPLSTVSTRWE